VAIDFAFIDGNHMLDYVLAPAWRILLRRADNLVNASLRRVFPSKMLSSDSQLNLPDSANYIPLQKLAEGYSRTVHTF
jgi:hypothetical protein